jgi:hypothetical protein
MPGAYTGCPCRACIAAYEDAHPPAVWIESMSNRFIVCPTCGNKRCPHASDHSYACTGSNATGQNGSVYA